MGRQPADGLLGKGLRSTVGTRSSEPHTRGRGAGKARVPGESSHGLSPWLGTPHPSSRGPTAPTPTRPDFWGGHPSPSAGL